MMQGRIVYLECPSCGNLIKEPFRVAPVPYFVTMLHRRGKRHRPCRLLIRIRPQGKPIAEQFPFEVSMETALLHATTESTPVEAVG